MPESVTAYLGPFSTNSLKVRKNMFLGGAAFISPQLAYGEITDVSLRAVWGYKAPFTIHTSLSTWQDVSLVKGVRVPMSPIRLERTFRALVEQWRKDVALVSSVEQMVLHPCYQRIIGIGPAAIPLLLRELQIRPDHWFWALSAITGENPVRDEDAGDIRKMTSAWIEWGKQHHYL